MSELPNLYRRVRMKVLVRYTAIAVCSKNFGNCKLQIANQTRGD